MMFELIILLRYLKYFLLILCFLFLLFILLFYHWQNLLFRRKYRTLPMLKQNIIFGVGLEIAKLDPKGLWDFFRKSIKNIGDVGCMEVLGAPGVYLMSVEDIETLFTSSQYITKGNEYLPLSPWLREGLLTSTGTKWHFRRKLLTPTFHFKILENFLPIFNRHAQLLTKQFMINAADYSAPVEIGPIISVCSLAIICETTMGVSLDPQSQEGSKYASAINRAGELIVKRIMTFWMHSNWAFYISPTGQEFKKIVRQIQEFTKTVIKQRKEIYESTGITSVSSDQDYCNVYKKRVSFLDCLLKFQRENPDLMTDDDIHEEVDTFMFEGHDTVATTITWSLFMIASYSDVQRKLQNEIKEIFDDSLRDITLQDINKMRYLDLVLKETLRLYPAVPILSRKIPVDLQTKSQYRIPAGMNVLVLPYLLHRDSRWYPEPEEFIPERFLPGVTVKRHLYAYIPFSAGFRNCIGQKFAILEAKITIATILRSLNISTTLKRNDVDTVPQLVLRASPQITLTFSPAKR